MEDTSMPVTYKRQDDLEALFEQFASIEQLENIEFPDPQSEKEHESKDED